MNKISEIYNKIPGKTILTKYRKRAIPPLWIWLRSSFYIFVGIILNVTGFVDYGKIIITLAFIQLVGVSLAFLFQEVAAGYKRRFGNKQG